jgi:hypothetical protein
VKRSPNPQHQTCDSFHKFYVNKSLNHKLQWHDATPPLRDLPMLGQLSPLLLMSTVFGGPSAQLELCHTHYVSSSTVVSKGGYFLTILSTASSRRAFRMSYIAHLSCTTWRRAHFQVNRAPTDPELLWSEESQKLSNTYAITVPYSLAATPQRWIRHLLMSVHTGAVEAIQRVESLLEGTSISRNG